MPGMECIYLSNINKKIKNCINNLLGFYYCKIKTSNKYIGLLPVINIDGITMPNGNIEGWYFSEELKFAYKHGYNIDMIKGYKFSRSKDVFKKYVEEFYMKKSTTSDKTLKAIAKALLNCLLGRFGMSIDKDITELVTEK